MLTEFVAAQPLLSIILFSLIVTTLLTFVYKKFTNQARIKEIKEKQKQLQARMKEEKDREKLLGLQRELMGYTTEMMKLSMKPLFITFLPLIAVFLWLKNLYTSAGVGDIIPFGSSLPIVGTGAGWLLSYILFSMAFNLILRKIFKLH